LKITPSHQGEQPNSETWNKKTQIYKLQRTYVGAIYASKEVPTHKNHTYMKSLLDCTNLPFGYLLVIGQIHIAGMTTLGWQIQFFKHKMETALLYFL
jgi:hypothetical protein